MKYRPHLTTYPRSGAHYFDRVFYKNTKFHIEHSHSVDWLYDRKNNKARVVITIARDPKDSIASYIAHEKNKFSGLDWYVNDTRVSQIITEYIVMYNFLYEHADYIIDFNDLVGKPEETVKRLFTLLDVSEKDCHLFDGHFGHEDPFFVESSKELPGYDRARLDDFNLDLCYFYYHRLLEKKIEV